MIDSEALLKDLKLLVADLEADLHRRTEGADSDLGPDIRQQLEDDYKTEFDAGRTAATWEAWLADQATQHAVAWLLSCVFVRFIEDNRLIDTPAIAGPLEDDRLELARDQHEQFIRANPQLSEREYLLSVFRSLADLPVADEVFGPHNILWRYEHWLSADAAGSLLVFFRQTNADTDGQITHDFADPDWDTRFLGDLYQDLSEATRKKYALLQTPDFVESFILDRTLEPALDAFGLEPTNPINADKPKLFKMIDPACGSGHFLLGGFGRIITRWQDQRPDLAPVDQVEKALASIHGVDLNPYAVAIARFRLLLAATRACGAATLKAAPNFHLNLAVGDSLLHGARGQQYIGSTLGGKQMGLDPEDPATQLYAGPLEDRRQLLEILRPGTYHAVVANPPYITVKDKAQNQNIRDRYGSCSGKYALSVPFMERIFELAIRGEHDGSTLDSAGFTGQITSNSFMKREFGKKLIETFMPRWDLTHMVDTSGAYIPGHGTPTVILFGRNRPPVADTLRAVQGIRGEPSTPDAPSEGLVWSAIRDQIDHPGSESDFISVDDAERHKFESHPWSIGGGGAAELKEKLDAAASQALDAVTHTIGVMAVTLEDDAYAAPVEAFHRWRLNGDATVGFVEGDKIRDWNLTGEVSAFFPYEPESIAPNHNATSDRHLWPMRTGLKHRLMFKKTQLERKLSWREYGMLIREKYRTPISITFAFVATHNHFVLDRSGKVFKQSAPVIKLPTDATVEDHFALLGLLNSSTACFWMKQVFSCKGLGGQGGGIKPEAWHRAYEFDSTKLKQHPIPKDVVHGVDIARKVDRLAQQVSATEPAAILNEDLANVEAKLDRAKKENAGYFRSMTALQEELDWLMYSLFGIADYEPAPDEAIVEGIHPQDRPVEHNLREAIARGEKSIFYDVQTSRGADRPGEMHPQMKAVIDRRRKSIAESREIRLIEELNYKRRWQIPLWEARLQTACRDLLLTRLEALFDLDGRMNDEGTPSAAPELEEPKLITVRRVSELAEADARFMAVAAVYRDRDDFEVRPLVEELVAGMAVPFLPVLRYKPDGLRKRAAWEETWKRQRQEDAVLDLFNQDKLASVKLDQANTTFDDAIAAVKTDEGPLTDKQKATVLKHLADAARFVAEQLALTKTAEALEAAGQPVARADRPMSTYADGRIIDLDRRAFDCATAVFGKIPVPPKYTSADFKVGWKHRGKLDVPKERWVSFPHCEGNDGSLVIAWAGYDHLQLATAIAGYYVHERDENGTVHLPLLTALGELIPWLKQWHNDINPEYGARMGEYFAEYLHGESLKQNTTVEQLKNWQPPAATRGRRATTARRTNDAAAETAAQD